MHSVLFLKVLYWYNCGRRLCTLILFIIEMIKGFGWNSVNTDMLLKLSDTKDTWVPWNCWRVSTISFVGYNALMTTLQIRRCKHILYDWRYKWMTYEEVSAAREAMGSGLWFNGIQKLSHFKEILILIFL